MLALPVPVRLESIDQRLNMLVNALLKPIPRGLGGVPVLENRQDGARDALGADQG